MLNPLLVYLGFICLVLAMPRHQRQLAAGLKLKPGHNRALRALGFALLGAAAVAGWAEHGLGNGLVYWVAYLCLAVLSLALLLAWHNNRQESKKPSKSGQ